MAYPRTAFPFEYTPELRETIAATAREREAKRHDRAPSDEALVKRLHAEGRTRKEIRAQTGLGLATISIIINHGSWRAYSANRRKPNEGLSCGG